MICAACQTSDAATRATLAVVNFILSGELPRQACLLTGYLLGLEKLDGSVRPIAISETKYHFGGICALRAPGWDIGAGQPMALLRCMSASAQRVAPRPLCTSSPLPSLRAWQSLRWT